MPEVLSQAQIDALLNSMNGGGSDAEPKKEEAPEKKYRKYDFSDPRKFTKDRLKMLNGIFENYSRVLNTRVNGLARETCEVEVETVEEHRYFDFANALMDGTVLTVSYLNLQGQQDDTPVLMYLSTPFMVSMMDRLTGGDGDVMSYLPDDYTYTELDLKLYESLVRDFVSVMGRSWENYIPLNFDFGRIETNPSLVQLIGMDETVVMVDMMVKFPNVEGRISICLPGVTLTKIFTAIDVAKAPAKKLILDEESPGDIMDNLRESTLEIQAELARTTLRLGDIYRLNVGDVIDLNQKQDTPIYLRIGGQQWFDGLMGVSEKKIAVKIKEVYHNAERRGLVENEQ